MAMRTGLGNESSRSFIARGISLRQLSFKHDYKRNTLVHALDRPYCRAEAIIAKALGVKPSAIWPSRYERRRRKRGCRMIAILTAAGAHHERGAQPGSHRIDVGLKRRERKCRQESFQRPQN